MDSNDRKLIDALFIDAAELEPAERSLFLDERCRDAPEIRRGVEELLRYDAEAPDDFIVVDEGFEGEHAMISGSPAAPVAAIRVSLQL